MGYSLQFSRAHNLLLTCIHARNKWKTVRLQPRFFLKKSHLKFNHQDLKCKPQCNRYECAQVAPHCMHVAKEEEKGGQRVILLDGIKLALTAKWAFFFHFSSAEREQMYQWCVGGTCRRMQHSCISPNKSNIAQRTLAATHSIHQSCWQEPYLLKQAGSGKAKGPRKETPLEHSVRGMCCLCMTETHELKNTIIEKRAWKKNSEQ